MSEYAKAEDPRDGGAGAPPPEKTPAEPRRRAFALPEGWPGIFLLLVMAAASGGLIAKYWPWASDNPVNDERMTALEGRVSQLAAGHTNAAAAGVYTELKRSLAALAVRLETDEARLTALEKAAPAATQATAPDTTGLHQQLAQGATDLASLAARLDRLERAGASAAQIDDAVAKFATLNQRIAGLDAALARGEEVHKGVIEGVNVRLGKIEGAWAARLEELASRAELSAADARLTRLEAANEGDTLRRAASILALADLAQTAGEGRPFKVELDAMAAAEPGDPAVRALAPFAATGVPTMTTLRARFPAAARNALDVVRTASATDVFSHLWANIEGLISIRRIGDVVGKDPDARLSRAQVRLNEGDLARAAAEVAAVGPPSSVVLAPWLRDARARLALDRAIADADARVVRALAATRGLPPAPSPQPQPQAPVSAPGQVPTPVPTPMRGRTP